ncbi:uncharacterized protein LOC124496884 isoform X2 [Dermatophagoides farinae]|uniref:uncharacterized protein LOC124496884 isoform X2 n=1 Tax=Dermatophagoides farinae TaxID=6954 RepID=UPI003F5EF9A7
MSHNNKSQMKTTNQKSIVNYEDDYEDIDLVSAQRHSTSSGKRRSDQYTSQAGYSHKDRDDHSHRQLIRSNDGGYKDNHSNHGSSHHYNYRSHDRSSSSRNRHRSSSQTSRNNSTNKHRERSESHNHHNKQEESRHKHGDDYRKSKRDRSHYQHSRTRSSKEPSMTNHGSQERRYHVRHSRHHHFHYGHRSSRSRSQDAERRMEQSSKPKEYESAIITSSKHSNVECNKSDNIKLVEDQIIVSSQIETVTESKPREPPAVLASVAAVVATMKAQQSSESVFNRISPHQTIPSQLTDIPKYYNAKMVNAAKLAQQAEKRKLLWGDNKGSASDKVKTSATTSANVWTNLKFQGEHGQAMTEKFRKLMGIKTTDNTNQQSLSSKNDDVKESSRHNEQIAASNQAKLFENLDQQYSIARRSTHLARGVGLGFTAAGWQKHTEESSTTYN